MGTDKPPSRAVIESPISVHTAEFGNLSQREAQVLSYAAAGYIDKQIGQQLGVSVNTLRTYWQRIRSKIGEAPRSALAAAYVTHIAQTVDTTPEPQFSPDWQVDLSTNIFSFLSDRPHPQRFLDGHPLEDVISSYVPEEQAGLRALIEKLRSGQLDAVFLTGRFNTPDGPNLASGFIQVEKDSQGIPVRLVGKRIAQVALSGPPDEDYDWILDLRSNMVTRISDSWLPHPVEMGKTIPLEQVIQNYHPDDQPKLRALMVCACRGQFDSFTFGGRVITDTGIVPTGAFVQTERDVDGRPIRLLGRRALSFNLAGEGGLLACVGTLSRDFETEELKANAPFRLIFQLEPDERDLISAMARRIIPEQASALRTLMKQALQAKIVQGGATYKLRGDESDTAWVRLEIDLKSDESRPLLLTVKAIEFK
jgi:DNA-binding CsgD family transcriptional regulator